MNFPGRFLNGNLCSFVEFYQRGPVIRVKKSPEIVVCFVNWIFVEVVSTETTVFGFSISTHLGESLCYIWLSG